MAVRIDSSVVINRPAQEVWDYISNPEHYPTWQGNVSEVRHEGRLQQGARFTSIAKLLGRRMETEFEVLEFQAPRRLVLKSASGPFPVKLQVDLEAQDGMTSLTTRGEAEPGGFFRLAEPLVERALRNQISANTATLKDLLEAQEA